MSALVCCRAYWVGATRHQHPAAGEIRSAYERELAIAKEHDVSQEVIPFLCVCVCGAIANRLAGGGIIMLIMLAQNMQAILRSAERFGAGAYSCNLDTRMWGQGSLLLASFLLHSLLVIPPSSLSGPVRRGTRFCPKELGRGVCKMARSTLHGGH